MKLISVQSRENRVARITQIHEDNPDYVHFCGKQMFYDKVHGMRIAVQDTLNCGLPQALANAKRWLKGAT